MRDRQTDRQTDRVCNKNDVICSWILTSGQPHNYNSLALVPKLLNVGSHGTFLSKNVSFETRHYVVI